MRPIVIAAVVLCAAVCALIAWGVLTVEPSPQSQSSPPAVPSSAHQPSRPTSTTSRPPVSASVPDPFTAGPDTVAEQALRIMFSPRPGVDRSGGDAFQRAAAWLSPRMLTAATARTESGPGALWDDWRSRNVTITPHVQLGCSGCSPDTPTSVQRVATIIQFATDPAGNTRAENALTAWVTLVRQQDGWRIDTLTF